MAKKKRKIHLINECKNLTKKHKSNSTKKTQIKLNSSETDREAKMENGVNNCVNKQRKIK